MQILGICGGNGLSLYPFKDDLIGNIEPRAIFHTPKNEQWYSNFDVPLIRKEFIPIKPDIIIGHPDCGHSSVLSYSRAKKLSDPKKNFSWNFFCKAIHHYKPKSFYLENLPNLERFVDLRKEFQNFRLHIFNE